MNKSLIVTFALVMCAMGAWAGDYRWGGSSKDNKIKKEDANVAFMRPGYGRCYLYRGAPPEIIDYQICVTGLTYITDWESGTSGSDGKFGNNTSMATSYPKQSSDLVSSDGGEQFTIIVVSTPTTSGRTATGPIPIGTKAYVAMFPITSVVKKDYVDITYGKAMVDADYSAKKIKFVEEIVPIKNGGYMWGTATSKSNYIVKNQWGQGAVLDSSNARIYLYLGTAEIVDNAIDLGRMTFLTSGIANTSTFGNYSSKAEYDSLIQDDRVDYHGGQAFTLLFISKGMDFEKPADMPSPLPNRFKSFYAAVQTFVSEPAETLDGVKCAKLVSNQYLSNSDNKKGIVFYDQIDYPPESDLATLEIPKSYIVSYLGADKTDEELMEGSTNRYPTASSPYSLMEGYVLGIDPENPDPAKQPVVQPAQSSSTTTVHLDVGNVTVNEKANAKLVYGLVSSASPDFSDPTQEVAPQESPVLEGALPDSGVKYYRAQIDVKGK